jgi:hypothetical protein
MHHKKLTAAVTIAALAIAAPVAQAAPSDNSIAPGRTFFGQVTSGQHPNRLVTLHNGTGKAHRIATIGISGSGGYVYTLPMNTALIQASGLPMCRVGLRLAAGAKCALDVRVHTVRAGWWRSVLRVAYANGWNNSGQLEAHVVAAPTTASRSTRPGSCTSIATASESCS